MDSRKTKTFQIRLTVEEWDRLTVLSKLFGRSKSEIICFLVENVWHFVQYFMENSIDKSNIKE